MKKISLLSYMISAYDTKENGNKIYTKVSV